MTNFAVDKKSRERVVFSQFFCFARHLKGRPVDLRERFSFITTPEETQFRRAEQKRLRATDKRVSREIILLKDWVPNSVGGLTGSDFFPESSTKLVQLTGRRGNETKKTDTAEEK